MCKKCEERGLSESVEYMVDKEFVTPKSYPDAEMITALRTDVDAFEAELNAAPIEEKEQMGFIWYRGKIEAEPDSEQTSVLSSCIGAIGLAGQISLMGELMARMTLQDVMKAVQISKMCRKAKEQKQTEQDGNVLRIRQAPSQVF